MSVHSDDPLRDALATALGTQYELQHMLGRGGMGAVYLAHETFLDRRVAVKVLPAEVAESSDGRARFLREARTAAKLTHPNIVPLHSFGEARDTLFYVMGYVDGESLEARLKRQPMSHDETRRVLSEMADALDYAHRMGVVHRDLKPDNVLLDRATGRAMLTDFGIAKQQTGGETLTQSGIIVGTPHYMSPEQASGERELDGRSDIYSLGVIGYRMLTGRLPFEGHGVQDVLVQHLTREPAPLSGAEMPDDLSTAVMRALAKDPAARWPDAGALRASLVPEGESTLVIHESLEFLPSLIPQILLFTYAGVFGFTLMYSWLRDPFFIRVIVAPPLGGAFVLLLMWLRRPRGFDSRRFLEIASYPPARWTMWWPPSLRRPGDVWPRLPKSVRLARNLFYGGIAIISGVVAPIIVEVVAWAMSSDSLLPSFIRPLMPAASWLGLAATVAFVAGVGLTVPWARRFGLRSRDAQKLLTEPTWGSKVWKRPEIAVVLSDAPASGSSFTPPSNAEVIRLISDAASRLEPSQREIGAQLSRIAREIGAALSHMDGEIELLSRDVDPGERARLEQRIAALKRTTPGVTSPMQDILQAQLELMQRLEDRRAEVTARRERLHAQLRTLSLHLADLRAGATADSLAASEITGQIRSLCRDIEIQVEATNEARTVTATPTPR